MSKLLSMVIVWALSTALAKIVVAMGIGFFTYSGVKALVQFALDQLIIYVGQLPSAVISLISLAGIDQAISILGAALLTRAAFIAAKMSVGLGS
ncbi:MAG: protein of unknown function DUF2523 [Inoviridae sp.]|nr:MAG: protein of unknown function DUF2523 [Inoviridae sp.]